MRLLALFFFFAFFGGTAWAQRLSGTYAIPTSNGVITLTLNEAASQITGTLVGDDGVTFQLQGQSEADDAMGAVLNQNGQVAYFEAYLDGQGLVFLLIPPDQQGQPNYEAASEFAMQRQGGTPGAVGAAPSNPFPQPQNPLGVPPAPPQGTPLPGQAAAGFSGTYSGAFNGTPTTLTLQQQGGTLQGEANASGYRYVLSGNVNGQMAQGIFSDPQTGGGFQFEMAMQGSGLTLTLLAQDPNTGQVQRIPAQFQRGAAAAQPGVQQGGYPPQAGSTMGGAADNVERDQRLVGVWRYSDTMISGEYSMVSETFMQVNPNGSYTYGNGRVMAGGSSPYGSIHGDTGSGGDNVSGQWRTQDSIVYIQEAGSPQWVPYARYYIEGGKMMFTFGDGSKQIWYRQ